MNHDQRYQATRNRNLFSCLKEKREEEEDEEGWRAERISVASWPGLVWAGLGQSARVLAGCVSAWTGLAAPGPYSCFPLSSCSEG